MNHRTFLVSPPGSVLLNLTDFVHRVQWWIQVIHLSNWNKLVYWHFLPITHNGMWLIGTRTYEIILYKFVAMSISIETGLTLLFCALHDIGIRWYLLIIKFLNACSRVKDLWYLMDGMIKWFETILTDCDCGVYYAINESLGVVEEGSQ